MDIKARHDTTRGSVLLLVVVFLATVLGRAERFLGTTLRTTGCGLGAEPGAHSW